MMKKRWIFAVLSSIGMISNTGATPPENTGPKTLQTAIFAAGCFWGTEDYFRKVPGVLETKVGYAGGLSKDASYEAVKTGKTKHAESVEIKYDPSKISYEDLLKHFFKIHDPTTLNRQGNDIGKQYRSAIFPQNEEQEKIAKKVIQKVKKSLKREDKVVTTSIEKSAKFYPAEEYHQKYLEKNPHGYDNHFVRDMKFDE